MSRYSRIERVLEQHPWMTEEEAGKLLVAKYYLLTRVEKMDSNPEVQAAMEEFTNELIVSNPDDLRGAINFANRNK